MTDQKTDNPEKIPGIYKEEEFNLMLRFVRLGMWKNVNLAKVCSVDPETIADWKKRPEVKKAYSEASERVLKKRYNIGDVEKLMKELGFEVDPDQLDITTMGNPIFGGKSVIPPNNSNE